MSLLGTRRIIGYIHHNIDKKLRILCRSKACERQKIIFSRTWLLFCGSRLSSNVITRYFCSSSRTIFHGLKHGLFQKFRSGRGYGLTNQDRILCLYHGTLLIHDLAHNMGLIIGASIDDRTECGSHLDHGTVVILSEGIGGKLRRPHIFRAVDQACAIRLTGKIYSCFLPHSKNGLVLCENILSHHGADPHHSYIAGLHDGLLKA